MIYYSVAQSTVSLIIQEFNSSQPGIIYKAAAVFQITRWQADQLMRLFW